MREEKGKNVSQNATSYRLNVLFGGGGLVIRSAFTLSDIREKASGKTESLGMDLKTNQRSDGTLLP